MNFFLVSLFSRFESQTNGVNDYDYSFLLLVRLSVGFSNRVLTRVGRGDLAHIIRLQVALGQALAMAQRPNESIATFQNALKVRHILSFFFAFCCLYSNVHSLNLFF